MRRRYFLFSKKGNTDEECTERVTWQKINYHPRVSRCIIICFFFLLGFLFEIFLLMLRRSVDIPSHHLMVRRGLITQSTCQVDMPLSCVTRGFSSRFERGGDFLFFEGSSWAESEKKKREFGRDRVKKKRCWGERKKKAWKGSEWWKSHEIWQDRFHQLKKKKKKSLLKTS